MSMDPIELSRKLIRCESVTPKDAGALDLLEEALTSLGFKCTRLPFNEDGTPDVDNLFARLGTGSPHFCYAGHTDVVPAGPLDDWEFPPFAAEVKDGILYGRGTSDMKCSIAAFIAAVSELDEFEGSISLLITGDEEGPAINGTVKMLKWLEENDQLPDVSIVGEPTNANEIGDMAKIGRRGSLNGEITVLGTQGHVAYPHLADNPIPSLVKIIEQLNARELDRGNEFFDPSNLEITSVDVGNEVTNVIPAKASAKFNIRYNNEHTADDLNMWIKSICDAASDKYTLDIDVSGDAFLTPVGRFSELIEKSIFEVTGKNVEFSTTGGTSDARFIKDYCPVVEFGLINKTIHKVNECVRLNDIIILKDIYCRMLVNYFSD